MKDILEHIKQTLHMPTLICDDIDNPTQLYIDTNDIKENNNLINWHCLAIIKILDGYGYFGTVKKKKGRLYISVRGRYE